MTPMVVQCSSCLTEFELDPRKVPHDGVRARCSVCSAVIVVPPPPSEPGSGAQAPVGSRAAQTGTDGHAHTRPYSATLEPHAGAESPSAPQPEQPAGAPWGGPQTTGHQRGDQAGPEAAQQAPQDAAPPASPTAPAPLGGRTGGEEQGAAASRRPINPFLARDPALRAKRLARALVSDIVAYHPARHAEGLREGTLKTLFRDEIKKSYEEYVDQVGRDFASSTTHFQDALNDVLAGGKKLF